jgi:hypothetical protein
MGGGGRSPGGPRPHVYITMGGPRPQVFNSDKYITEYPIEL